jgi:hypothetical protein
MIPCARKAHRTAKVERQSKLDESGGNWDAKRAQYRVVHGGGDTVKDDSPNSPSTGQGTQPHSHNVAGTATGLCFFRM